MNYLDHMSIALTYKGNRFKEAWLMARASYAYTCSFIGNTDPSMGEPVFTHWDALKGAIECAWDTFKRGGPQHRE